MAYLALWPTPHPLIHGDEVSRFVVERGASADPASWVEVANIVAKDRYDNWVTHWVDENGSSTDYYRTRYIDEDGEEVGDPWIWEAEIKYEIGPQDIIDNMQGLPLNHVDSKFIQNWIRWAVERFEVETGMLLSVRQVTKEIHTSKVFHQLVYDGGAATLRLRNRPVIDDGTIQVYYRIRARTVTDRVFTGISVQLDRNAHPDGYNSGRVSLVATYNDNITTLGNLMDLSLRRVINVLVDYKHGFSVWPRGVKELVMRWAAKDVMEVAGLSETAGVSSNSIDNYAESFTASATTTTLSASRMYYEEEIKKLSKFWKKPGFSFG